MIKRPNWIGDIYMMPERPIWEKKMRHCKGMGLANMSGGDCRGGRGKFYIVKKLPQCQNVGEKLCGAQRCCVSG